MEEAIDEGSCRWRKMKEVTNGEAATTNAQWKELNALEYKQHCKIIKESITSIARSAHKMKKKKHKTTWSWH
jgi:hypothetical protein